MCVSAQPVGPNRTSWSKLRLWALNGPPGGGGEEVAKKGAGRPHDGAAAPPPLPSMPSVTLGKPEHADEPAAEKIGPSASKTR